MELLSTVSAIVGVLVVLVTGLSALADWRNGLGDDIGPKLGIGAAAAGILVIGPGALLGLDERPPPPPPEPGPLPAPAPPTLFDEVIRPLAPWIVTAFLMLVAGVLALALLGVGVRIVVQGSHRRRERAQRATTGADNRRTRWHDAEQRYNEVRQAYTAYATDPLRVLDEPVLNDVRDHYTAWFHDALDAADRAHRDHCPDTDTEVDTFTVATRDLARAWRVAEQHARTLGTTELPPQHAQQVRTARALLERALHHDTPDAERHTAYRAAHDRLRGVLLLPQEALAALEHHHRLALPRND